MKRQLMAEQWDSFARQIIPPGAPAVQRQEMRRAFYAGAQAILYGILTNLAPEHDPTPEDLQALENVAEELRAFAKHVKEGRA